MVFLQQKELHAYFGFLLGSDEGFAFAESECLSVFALVLSEVHPCPIIESDSKGTS